MKVIIAGSRTGFVARNVFEAVEESPFVGKITEVVSGGARGVDRDGEYYAKCRGLPFKQFIPEWDEYGKGAGFRRNKEMANYADALVAVWDGESRGTANMIKTMETLGKPVYVYKK
jgi:hypothetical protein